MLQSSLQQLIHADTGTFLFWLAVLAILTLLCLYGWLRNIGKARLIEDTPTSSIRSAAQGYVELEGQGRPLPDSKVIAPLTGSPCLWWSYSIEKKVQRDRKTTWKTVEHQQSDSLFILEDKTGDCLVDPQGAEVHPSLKRRWYGHSRWPKRGPGAGAFSLFARYRYTEQRIQENVPLYVLGLFRTQRASDGHFDESSEVSALMREWKRDQDKMLRLFDTDKDGEVSSVEWEAARRVALKKVREVQLERAIAPGLHVLSKPMDKKDFLISTRSQDHISRRYRLNGMLLLLLFICGTVAMGLMLRGRGLI